MSNCIICAGPTRADLSREFEQNDPAIIWQPPVQRGSIAAIIEQYPVSNLAIVDGLFHHSPAVGHAEIRDALSRGWRVWGLSSMGAIRACEMRAQGMRGFGRVYQHFVDDEDLPDDEVALLHEAAPNYRACSEPLIHIRAALRDLMVQGLLESSEGETLLSSLASRWFGERTLPLLLNMIAGKIEPERAELIKRALRDFSKYRLKTHDLRDFITERIWLRAD